MIWLYHLQQRLSITRQEGLAILTLTLLFITGLTVRHVQEQKTPPVAVEPLVAQPATDSASSTSPTNKAPTAENPISLNSASVDALQTLPGIGPALAERIEAYRSTQRPFQRAEELRRVRGIGRKTLAKLRPLIHVSTPEETTD